MSESDEWLAKHKGEHIKTVGWIWECHDECGCREAQVVSYYRNKVVHNARVPITDWSGDFYTSEWGDNADEAAEVDLAEYRRTLRETDPQREAAIEWQRGVDYEARRSATA